MALVELAITIEMEASEAERMRVAFARRMRNPVLTLDLMLAWLKSNAITQIQEVVLAEERAKLDEQKALIPPLVMD